MFVYCVPGPHICALNNDCRRRGGQSAVIIKAGDSLDSGVSGLSRGKRRKKRKKSPGFSV